VRDYDDKKKLDKKSVQVITGISPNTLQACSKNHRVRAIETKKTWVFWSNSSRTIAASPLKIITKAGTTNGSSKELSDPRTKGQEVRRNEPRSGKEALLRARLLKRKANDRAHLHETET
jgi:hypothetical protein